MKLKKLGLPYKGSKRKLADKIIKDILKIKPNTRYVYDLFGGGGAISFTFLQIPSIRKVIYNDIDTGVVELIKYVLNNGVVDEMYKWVDRETFNNHKKDPNWYGGFIKLVWSFGNSQKGYLYGEGKEDLKRLFHNYIVYNNIKDKRKAEEKIKIKLPSIKMSLFGKDINKDRLLVSKYLRRKGKRLDLRHLEAVNLLKKIEYLKKFYKSKNAKLTLLNKSYNEVDINTPIEETIIYLDPPYMNTHKYENDIDYKELKEWIHKCRYPVFLSELNSYYELKVVSNYEHIYTFSKDSNNTKVVEKLFWNGR